MTHLTYEQANGLHFGMLEDATLMLKNKRVDYSGSDDPFGNLRACEAYGVPATLGVVIRMSDKLSRIASMIREGTLHCGGEVGESARDTLIDIINYSTILYGLLTEDSAE